MKKLYNTRVTVAALAVVMAFSTFAPYLIPTAQAAGFNQGSQPYKTLRGYNFSDLGSCTTCWQNDNVDAEVGDTVTFRVFYNNTSNETAEETRVQITPSVGSDGRTATITGRVWASNAGTITDTVTVRVPSGQKITSLDHVATFWYDGFQNQMSLGGQPQSQVLSSSGLDVGSTLPGLANARFVVARFEVKGTTEEAGNAPLVNTLSATDIDRDSARLRGEANPRGDSTEVWFEWGTSSSKLNRETSRQSVGSGNNFTNFSASISGLDPDTTYAFRAVARNDFGTSRGDIRSFTTNDRDVGRAPDVRTLSATDVSRDSARLRGEADPNDDSTRIWFEWGRSSSNLNRETSEQSIGGGTNFVDFSSFVSGLDPDTTYSFRAVARNSFGTSRGEVRSFTTSDRVIGVDRPSVRVLAATNITTNSANIRGEANPNGSQTDTWFEWGTNPNNLSIRTGTLQAGSGNSFIGISSFLAGLNSNTTYYYRVVAENAAGRSVSGIESFRTNFVSLPQPPSVITQVVRVFERERAVPAEQVIKLTLEADKSELGENRITYVVTWENLTARTLRDASIEVRLPDELEFDDASRSVDEIRDNTLVFRLGSIRGGERGEIEVETDTQDLEAGDTITVTASLSYLDTNNTRYIVSVEDTSEITEEDLTGGLTANILDAIRDFLVNPIFWLLIGLLLLYLIYRFLTARRQPSPPYGGYPGTGSGPTVVAYPPAHSAGRGQAGGPGAQMYPAPQAPQAPPEPPPFG